MSQPGDFLLPAITLDRASPVPLHQQVRSQIARAIRNGAHAGARLPSTRALANLLGVSRNTVFAAYDDLVAAGMIQGRRGSAMLVSSPGNRGVMSMDPRRVLKEAQYPARTLSLTDADGTSLYLTW